MLLIGFWTGIHPATAQFSKLMDFDGTNGSSPDGSLLLIGDALYGMAQYGGANGDGCIFKINTDGTGYTDLFDFSGTADGERPHGSLTLSGNVLYGMTMMGGTNNLGCIFKINIDGSGYDKLFDFNGLNAGSYPYSTLALSGNWLYGMASEGGNASKGSIFKINTTNGVFTKLFDFTGTSNGSNPSGSLVVSGDVLYGMARYGGANDMGCIFKINTDGTGYTQLLDFSGANDGEYPHGSLTLAGGKLYGMAIQGGANGQGCIFSLNTDGSGFTRMFDFNSVDNGGYYPSGSLTCVGNIFYGMTSIGGVAGNGCIFQYDPDHDGLSRLKDFNGTADGNSPYNDVIVSGGTLYGMTYYGGSYDDGVIFKYILKPSDQASQITFPSLGFNFADITWSNGNGERRAVFLKEGSGPITDPVNNTTYTAGADWNNKGSQLGTSGYYCIYNGPGNMVSVTQLAANTDYTVQVYEYNGDEGNEQYSLSTGAGNPNSFHTSMLTGIGDDKFHPVKLYSDGSGIYAYLGQRYLRTQLSVYNLSGICVARTSDLNEGLNRIEVPHQPGIYLVTLVLDDHIYTEKIRLIK
jgi:uncharacterized repeat protein (TIGR03803 family)